MDELQRRSNSEAEKGVQAEKGLGAARPPLKNTSSIHFYIWNMLKESKKYGSKVHLNGYLEFHVKGMFIHSKAAYNRGW